MDKPSFLLCLSGSEQSQIAAQFAFEMAKKSDAQITAQHVIDTITSWEILRNDQPGFVGSGLYVETFELLKNAQKQNASKLFEKYESVAESQKVISTCVLDEGDPVEQISKKAKDHDLVIAGHYYKKDSANKKPWRQVHVSIAEGLASHCPKPLLIVQKSDKSFWQELKILVSGDHLNISFIRACLRTAMFFGLTPSIICLMSGFHEEKTKELIKDLRRTHSDLKDVKIETLKIRRAKDVNQDHVELWTEKPIEIEFDYSLYKNSLLVIPTREIGNKRISLLQVEAKELVSKLTIPALLLWPEESINSHKSEDRDFEKLTA